jgi:uncharacterized protein involved in exopolysaccharide biosynthesis
VNFTSTAPPYQPVDEASGDGHSHLFSAPEFPDERGNKAAKLRLFWERRRLFGRVAIYAALASTLIAFLIPSRYRAKAQLMPPDGQQGLGAALMSAVSSKGAGALGALGGDLLGARNSGALFVGVLKSRTVADRVIEEFDLRRVYHESKMEDAREYLENHTEISEDRKNGIVGVSVTDHDPRRAAAMAQAYLNELDRLIAQVSTSAARRERVFLEGRLHEVKDDLDAASRRFSEFASKNTALDIPAQGRAAMQEAGTLQGQLIAAESELKGLEQIYADSNVRVRSLRARINELRQHLQKMGGNPDDPSNDEGLIAPSIKRLPLLGVKYADLYRQNKIRETVFELLTQQYEMAKVQEAKEIPSVKVLDVPVVPTKKAFPPRFILICVGTLLGLAGTAGWIIYRKKWEEMDPNDPGRVLAIEVGSSLRAGAGKLAPAAGALRSALSHGSMPSGQQVGNETA